MTVNCSERPSPSQSASETEEWTVKKGNDGGQWVVKADSKGVKRWVAIPSEKGKAYETHFNGARAYKVFVSKDRVVVYERSGYCKKRVKGKDVGGGGGVFLKKVLEIESPLKVFTGGITDKSLLKKYGTYQPIGNSLLIHAHGNVYYFIGELIARFTAKSAVRQFFSALGNSDVPYPWAISDETVYLFAGMKAIPRDKITNLSDPYLYYSEGNAKAKFAAKNYPIPSVRIVHSPL